MIKKIIHSADWHILLYERHEEYAKIFDKFCEMAEVDFNGLDYNERLFVVAGDIFDQFTKPSNEANKLVGEILRKMADIARIVIIAGNHDFNEHNVEEMDTITPVITLLNDPRITYYKESKCYLYDDNLIFAVYSVFEESKRPFEVINANRKDVFNSDSEIEITDEITRIKEENPNRTMLGLYHAPIRGAATDKNIKVFEKYKTDTSIFDGCDAVLMGDIHKYQVIKHNDLEKTVDCVYSSSLVQQTFGENVTNHGYVLWEIEKLTHNFKVVPSDYGLYTFKIADKDDFINNKERITNGKVNKKNKKYNIPQFAKIKVIWEDFAVNQSKVNKREIKFNVSKKYNVPISEIKIECIKLKIDEDSKLSTKIIDNISNNEILYSLYEKYIKDNYELSDEELCLFKDIDDKVNSLLLQSNKDTISGEKRDWKILWFKASNFLSFKEVYRSFENESKITLINSIPSNRGGKSNLTRTIMFLVYGQFFFGGNKSVFEKVFNKFIKQNECVVEGELEIDNIKYYLKRTLKKNEETGNVTHRFKIFQYDENGKEKINNKAAISLNKKDAVKSLQHFQEKIGTIEDFIFTSMFDSLNVEKWIETKPTKRFNLFSEYLGLKKLEDKFLQAKELYNQFVKSSKFINFSIEDTKLEISELTDKIKSDSKELKSVNSQIKDIELKISNLEHKIHNNVLSKKYAPDNINLELLQADQLKYENQIQDLQFSIVKKQNLLAKYNPDDETKINSLKEELNNVKAEDSLYLELSNLQNSLDVTIDKLKKEKEVFQTKLNEITGDYKFVRKLYEDRMKDFNNVPVTITCQYCDKVISDSSSLKIKLTDELSELEKKIESIIEAGKDIKKSIADVDNKIKIKEEERNKKINILQESIKTIEKKLRDEIQNKIYECLALKDLFKDLKFEQAQLVKITEQLDTVKNKIIEYFKFKDTLETNLKIDFQIRDLNIQKNILQKEKYELENLQTSKAVSINTNKTLIEEKKNLIELISKDVLADKVYKIYLSIHGTEGLAKHIIMSVLPQINSELEEIISEVADFRLYIDFSDKGIEFMVEKDNVTYELYMCSGLEKTISCLALHYVNMKISTLPTPNILILDEIFSGVSDENLPKVYPIIEKLLECFLNVDLITHRTKVTNWAENILTIKKENNISTLINSIT